MQYRTERLAVYSLLDFYGLRYESVDADSRFEGQNGPRHCSECSPYFVIPAKWISVFGPANYPLKTRLNDVWTELGGKKKPQKRTMKVRSTPPLSLLVPPPNGSTNVLCLPLDVLTLILGRLTFGDVFCASLACREFARVVRREMFWALNLQMRYGAAEFNTVSHYLKAHSNDRFGVEQAKQFKKIFFSDCCKEPDHTRYCSYKHQHLRLI